jgi:hypothetical protein
MWQRFPLPVGEGQGEGINAPTFPFLKTDNTVTLLLNSCVFPLIVINFFNSSRISSLSLHDCLISVFYAFRALLSL